MKRSLRGNLKGISTIIATIIIVAISIVMAIAVAYWAMGIGNSFTKFEKIEFISIYSDTATYYNGTIQQPNGNWFNGTAFPVVVTIKNTGTAAATVDTIFLDTRPYTTFSANVSQSSLVGRTLSIGQQITGRIYLPVGGTWSSGNTVAVTISTAAGREYPNFVVLP
jgi:FlaG/FlaF family flagellin (archaellin)